jgi:hypothetical protein
MSVTLPKGSRQRRSARRIGDTKRMLVKKIEATPWIRKRSVKMSSVSRGIPPGRLFLNARLSIAGRTDGNITR